MFREFPELLPEETIAYLRKSRSDDPSLTVEEVLSKHESILNDWAKQHMKAPLSEKCLFREVVSGENINSRPEFKKLLKRIESPEIKAVLVVECARLGRPDLEEIGKISKLFRYTNTLIVTPQRTFDLHDEWDREAFEREMMRGAEYLEYTKKILRRGKEASLRAGWYINAVTPYGYERHWVPEGNRQRPSLKIVEDEAQIVRMIFDWYVNDGLGATKICQKLNAIGIPSRKGGLWKKSSVVNIIKNEHYTGKIVIKKHIKVNVVEDYEITKHSQLNEDYEVVDGKHPAIIDESLFTRANNKIHKHIATKPNEKLQNPFAGILKCQCGKTMIRKPNRNSYRYLCDEQTICGNASVLESELIPSVISILKQHLDNITASARQSGSDEKKKHSDHIALLEAELFKQEKKELSLWDKYAEEQMPQNIFDKLMSECKKKKQNLENELQTAYANAPKQANYSNMVASLHEAIESLSDDSVSASTKNKILKSIIDKIVYHREKPTRMTSKQAEDKGVNLVNGWYSPKFELDITLKL